MSLDAIQKTYLRFDQLGVTSTSQLLQLFSALRSDFDTSIFAAESTKDRGRLQQVADAWTNKPEGILHRLQANWIDSAPAKLRSTVENAAEHLHSHIQMGIRAVQPLTQLGVHNPGDVAGLFRELQDTFDKDIATDHDETDLEITRMNWLGRKTGILTWASSHWIKSAPPELKRSVGEGFNKLKSHVESTLKIRHDALAQGERAALASIARHAVEALHVSVGDSLGPWRDGVSLRQDLSLPGVERPIGTRHLIWQTYEELQRIFLSIGFSVVEGPEIETPYYNFEALNIPEHHPARDNMDTFYIEGARGGHLLRTHTSPMQIRTMEKQPPPVRIIVPGKVYRRDNPDATHGYMFHQIEGLAVDTDITFADFKGTVEYFVREFLGPHAKTRLRPSYFPFTEPSAEVDATCHVCGGNGCRVCKFSGWIELFGAGMVNPAVYGFVKYDAERLSGFAFGMGVDRLAMMKYGISELPLLYQNDVRFLRQFP
jgi:phenylalanyl-tRNA synthetase alpha chain